MDITQIAQVRPTTLEGIKRLAKRIKKVEDIAHHAALDKASKQAGFENFNHARNVLKETP